MNYEQLTKKELIELLVQKDSLVDNSVKALVETRHAVEHLKIMFNQKDEITEKMIDNDRKNAEEMSLMRHENLNARRVYLTRGFFIGVIITSAFCVLLTLACN